MGIGQGIDDALSVPTELDQMGLLQDAQLVRYGALGSIDDAGDIIHAALLIHQGVEDLDACGISEYLEEVCQFVEQFVFGHLISEGVGAHGS